MLDRKYIRYYIYGYLNMYFTDRYFAYDSSMGSYKQHRLRSVLLYLGLKETKRDISWLSPVFSIFEVFLATLFVFVKALVVTARFMSVKRVDYCDKIFFASLIFASFRVKNLLQSVRPAEISTLKIPFIKNEFCENEIDILSCVTFKDIYSSLITSWFTIWTLYIKYRHRDPLFRSYSCYEYYLTCCFVARTENDNRFVFYNTYDRWAFLMCNTYEATFIQHGKLMDTLKLIKIGTPDTAYYLNPKQKEILEKILLKKEPNNVKYRNLLEFTSNDLLLDNGKKNVLLVCWNNNIDKEWEICKLLHGTCNLYIKPHPGDKDNPAYPKMAEKYHCAIIPKTDYPHVDVVVSYDSTLADEYEDVDVKVIRYDELDDLKEIKKMI